MREQFKEFNFRADSIAIINQANAIISEYTSAGFVLTLRQLYYQFVARDLIENTMRSYKRLGSIINNARLAGLIDWQAIEDRTRNLARQPKWDGPAEVTRWASSVYRRDLWATQEHRVEVWIEKEALAGVIEGVCIELDVPFFSCRGYVSQSEQWAAGKRFARYADDCQRGVILHLGDHDPSGIDMTRDNFERVDMFSYGEVLVKRIALNWAQIEELNPPPNPAKLTDSRAGSYVAKYGRESWELDALDPVYLERLIRNHVNRFTDDELMQAAIDQQEAERAQILELAEGLE